MTYNQPDSFMESINQARRAAGRLRRNARKLFMYSFATTISLAMAASADAQTFAEWIQQNKTQKKYLLEQIEALYMYGTYLKKGYKIASTGLGDIGNSVKQEFSLHSAYYGHLAAASPVVTDDPRVKDITRWQQEIILICSQVKEISGLTTDEQGYFSKVCAAVLHDCDAQLTQLETVVGDNQSQMTDAERLEQLGHIRQQMQSNYRFSMAFAGQVKIYALNRQRGKSDARE